MSLGCYRMPLLRTLVAASDFHQPCIPGGTLGAAYSGRTAAVDRRTVSESLSARVVIPVIAFVAALLLFRLPLWSIESADGLRQVTVSKIIVASVVLIPITLT